jgi:adenylylsulfate kinase-like enzyme
VAPPRLPNVNAAIRRASITARAGELPNFTGIDQPYETPEISLDTSVTSAEAARERIVGYLQGISG